MENYIVTIGDETFTIPAKDNQDARYKAARIFKALHDLRTSAADIAYYASTKLLTAKEKLTTEELIRKFS